MKDNNYYRRYASEYIKKKGLKGVAKDKIMYKYFMDLIREEMKEKTVAEIRKEKLEKIFNHELP